MSAEERKLWSAFQKTQGKVAELEKGIGRAGRTSKRVGQKVREAFDPKQLAAFAGGLVGVGGIAGAVSKVSQGFQVWVQNLREISTEARKAGNEILAFAALQAGGTKMARVERTSAMGAEFGIHGQRGLTYNAAQALQSAIAAKQPDLSEAESFERGLGALRTVFAAKQAGVSLDAALEAEIQGAAQKMPPGQMLRNLYIAGERSARTPELLAKAAPSLMFFDDKVFGAAAAAELASPYAQEIKVYTKRGGKALSMAGGAADWYRKQGLTEASQMERLQALSDAGLDTIEKLQLQAGVSEIREAQSLAVMTQKLPAIVAKMGFIMEGAVPGMLAQRRGAVEAEVPQVRRARELDILQAQFGEETAFGRYAPRAMRHEMEQRVRGLAFRRLGVEQSLWFDLVDSEGRASRWDEARAGYQFEAGGPRIRREARAILEELGYEKLPYGFEKGDFSMFGREWNEPVQKLDKAAERLENAAAAIERATEERAPYLDPGTK
jgi:hypothetical protein